MKSFFEMNFDNFVFPNECDFEDLKFESCLRSRICSGYFLVSLRPGLYCLHSSPSLQPYIILPKISSMVAFIMLIYSLYYCRGKMIPRRLGTFRSVFKDKVKSLSRRASESSDGYVISLFLGIL